MIENFFIISKEGLEFQVKLEFGQSLYSDDDMELVRKVINSPNGGIKWYFNNLEIIKIERNRRIRGYPAVGQKYVVAIFGSDDPNYPSPQNALVYNEDGSEHLQLSKPKLISELYNERKYSIKYTHPYSLRYDQVTWKKDSKNNIVTCVRIGFDREYYEDRVLDPVTGELGECLRTGKY